MKRAVRSGRSCGAEGTWTAGLIETTESFAPNRLVKAAAAHSCRGWRVIGYICSPGREGRPDPDDSSVDIEAEDESGLHQNQDWSVLATLAPDCKGVVQSILDVTGIVCGVAANCSC